MDKIAVIASFTTKPEATADVEAALLELVGVAASEDGTEQYVVHRDQSNPATFWLYELYTDMGALGAHSGSPQLAAFMATLGDVLAAPPVLAVLSPIAAAGVDL